MPQNMRTGARMENISSGVFSEPEWIRHVAINRNKSV